MDVLETQRRVHPTFVKPEFLCLCGAGVSPALIPEWAGYPLCENYKIRKIGMFFSMNAYEYQAKYLRFSKTLSK